MIAYINFHQTVKEALVKAYIEEGIGGLYSGLGSSLFGIALTNGVYYAFCEFMERLFSSVW